MILLSDERTTNRGKRMLELKGGYGIKRVHQVDFDLAALMRKHGVTIRELKARTHITMKRIREIRAMDRVPYTTYADLHEAVTGEVVSDYATYANGLS